MNNKIMGTVLFVLCTLYLIVKLSFDIQGISVSYFISIVGGGFCVILYLWRRNIYAWTIPMDIILILTLLYLAIVNYIKRQSKIQLPVL